MPICLSNTLNLRCLDLTRPQSIFLIIPTALEFLTTTLILTVNLILRRGSYRYYNKREWLLVLEGWSFLAMAILDTINHALPLLLRTFKIIDIVIGATSTVPLLSLTLFLFLLTTPSPSRSWNVGQARIRKGIVIMMIATIPLLVVLNESSSFVGIRYSADSSPSVAFPTLSALLTFTALSLTSLSLLLAYIVISSALYISNLVQSRSPSSFRERGIAFPPSSLGPNRGRLGAAPPASAWFALLSFLLFALEVLVGLVVSSSAFNADSSGFSFVAIESQDDFGRILARRILRACGRASLIIAVIKQNKLRKEQDENERFLFSAANRSSAELNAPSPISSDVERARRRGRGRLSKLFSSYVFDPRVQIPDSETIPSNHPAQTAGARTSWLFPFRVSRSSSSSPFAVYGSSTRPRFSGGMGAAMSPSAWIRPGRRPRWRDLNYDAGPNVIEERERRKKQRVTVEYTKPGAPPMLKLRKLSNLSWGELDLIALKALSPTKLTQGFERARRGSFPFVSPDSRNGRSGSGNGSGSLGGNGSGKGKAKERGQRPHPLRQQQALSRTSIEVIQTLIPEFPSTPVIAHTRGASGPTPVEGVSEISLDRTASGRRKPVPRLSTLPAEDSSEDSAANVSANLPVPLEHPSETPDVGTQSPPAARPRFTHPRAIRDSLTLAFGNRVKRLSSFNPLARAFFQAHLDDDDDYERSIMISPSSSGPQLSPDLDPFRKNSPRPPPEPLAPPPIDLSPPPLSPSTLTKTSPLSATAASASRSVSAIGPVTESAVNSPISAPRPLQPSQFRRLAMDTRQGTPEPLQTRSSGLPPSSMRARLQSLTLALRSPSTQLFPNYRLSSSSTVSGSQISSPCLSYTYPSPITGTSDFSPSVYSPPPPPPVVGATPARIASPSSEPPSSMSMPIGRWKTPSRTPTTAQSTPRLSSVVGVIHQTPKPAQQHFPVQSVTAVPIPVMRIRGDPSLQAGQLMSESEYPKGIEGNAGNDTDR